jgi:hypothetical protein
MKSHKKAFGFSLISLSESSLFKGLRGPLARNFFKPRLSDDLAHALGRQPLMGSDLVIGPALAQPRENAPAPQHPPVRGEPARERRRPLVDHACLARPPAWRPLLTERQHHSADLETRKEETSDFPARGPWAVSDDFSGAATGDGSALIAVIAQRRTSALP